MNKSFKKYKCHYKNTRFAKILISKIAFMRAAMVAQVIASGQGMLNAIAASERNGALKMKAYADCSIKTAQADARVSKVVSYPNWYKKAPN